MNENLRDLRAKQAESAMAKRRENNPDNAIEGNNNDQKFLDQALTYVQGIVDKEDASLWSDKQLNREANVEIRKMMDALEARGFTAVDGAKMDQEHMKVLLHDELDEIAQKLIEKNKNG